MGGQCGFAGSCELTAATTLVGDREDCHLVQEGDSVLDPGDLGWGGWGWGWGRGTRGGGRAAHGMCDPAWSH